MAPIIARTSPLASPQTPQMPHIKTLLCHKKAQNVFSALFVLFCGLTSSRFDAVTAAPHLHAREAAGAQRLFDLSFGAKVFVAVSQRVVRVEDGPLREQVRCDREDTIIVDEWLM